MAQPTVSKARPAIGGGIIAIVAIAAPLIAAWEGKRNDPYRDIVGVPTVCYGTTSNFEMRRHSDQECRALLERDMGDHLNPVLTCVPRLLDRPKVAAASLSLAYNIGAKAFCQSTAARRFNAGDWEGGCEAVGWFTRANGKVVQGLVNRRKAEVKLCMEGMA